MSSDSTKHLTSKQVKSKLPRAVGEGIIKIGNIEIQCAVLDDGKQVISQTSLLRAMGRSRGGGKISKEIKLARQSGKQIPVFVATNNLLNFIPSSLTECACPPLLTL